jgi:hypothetical protein
VPSRFLSASRPTLADGGAQPSPTGQTRQLVLLRLL